MPYFCNANWYNKYISDFWVVVGWWWCVSSCHILHGLPNTVNQSIYLAKLVLRHLCVDMVQSELGVNANIKMKAINTFRIETHVLLKIGAGCWTQVWLIPGWGHFTKCLVRVSSTRWKNVHNRYKVLQKWWVKRSKNNGKGGQQDRKSRRKLVQNGQMIDFGKEIHQLQVKLSLELNVIETKQVFYRKRGLIRSS